MAQTERGLVQWLFAAYYAGTVVFVLLDYLLDFNVRLAFLERWPTFRALYYVVCFGLFVLIWRYPAWTNTIAAAESLITISALIIAMGLRVVIVSDAMIEEGRDAVTLRELLNFLIAAGAAYLALVARSRAARRELASWE